jgi:hypothetical protein
MAKKMMVEDKFGFPIERELTESTQIEAKEKWHIVDWTNTIMFDGQKFDSAEDAEAFLAEKLGDQYENDRQEYEIIPDKGSRDARYLDPKDPHSGQKKAVESVVESKEDSVAAADVALKAFSAHTGSEGEEAVVDLLADLMHWCDKDPQVTFEKALTSAQNHYDAEVGEVDESVQIQEGTARATLKKYEALKTKPMWTKQEILGVAHRLSDLARGWKQDMDEEMKYILHEILAMFEEGKLIDISPEQSQQGIAWLKKNVINAKGELRDTGMVRDAQFNVQDAEVIKNFKEFRLAGFHEDKAHHIYSPIYLVKAADGNYFNYSVSGGWGGASISLHRDRD